MDHVTVPIGQDLDLNVPRCFNILFQIQIGISEGGLGFTGGERERLVRHLVRTCAGFVREQVHDGKL